MFLLREILFVSLMAHWVTSATIPSPALITKYSNLPINFRDGSYSFIYEGDDGTTLMERGQVKRNNKFKTYLAVTGTYTYTDQQGKTHMVPYNSNKKPGYFHANSELSHRIGTTNTPNIDINIPLPTLPPVNNLPQDLLGSLVGGGLG